MSSFWPLFALAVAAFGIGTTEFAPMGLLPTIAHGLDVSIPTAGQLITAYAVGVMLGAPFVTLGLARLRRKQALIGLMGLFTVGNVLSAFAPDYLSLLASRVLTSFCHGAFFGIGAVTAAALVPPAKRASAVSVMFMGLTIANIGGVPAATWLGQAIGWRMAFLATAGLGVLAMLALLVALPRGDAGRLPAIRTELLVMLRPQVQLALATTSLAAGAMFTLYTYIAPVLAHVAGATPVFVTAMLVLTGIGFTLGNMIGGRLADRSMFRALAVSLTALAAVLVLFPVVATSWAGAALMVLLWGVATFAAVPALQTGVMHAAEEAPGLASSINIGAFNLGNALGAALGGGVISAGLGYGAVPVAGAGLAVLALFVTFGSAALARRRVRAVAA